MLCLLTKKGVVAAVAMAAIGLTGSIFFASCAATNTVEDDGGGNKTTSTTGSGGGGGSGGDTTSNGGSTSTGSGGSGTGGSGTGGVEPSCQPVDGVVLAFDKLQLGDGSPSWTTLGFDVDGQDTQADFAMHCKPYTGATESTVFPDGNNGIDNSFGKNVMPLFTSYIPDLSTQANSALSTGQFTLMLYFEKLGAGADQDPLVTKLYGGGLLAGGPLWDGNDCWPVVKDGLTDPLDITSSKTVFPTASLKSDVWESNGTTTMVLPINYNGFPAPLTIYKARLSAQLAPSHKGAALGLIGGVLDTEELVEVVRDVAGTMDPMYCGALFDGLFAEPLRQASDIMKDGTQDPNSVCNGISVGLGFTMLEVIFGSAVPAAPEQNPCP